jgi:hypothetical protein
VKVAVPRRDFRKATDAFGLSEVDRLRLAEELGRLNLSACTPRWHADGGT